MSFFDLHCHSTLKPMFSDPEHRPDCWKNLKITVDFIVGNIVDSQSSLTQLLDGEVNLACIALSPLEASVANRRLLKVVDFFVTSTFINKHQLKNIANAKKGFRYNDLLISALKNLEKTPKDPNNSDRKIKILHSINEYDKSKKDTLHIVLSVEGGHAFFHDKNKCHNPKELLENLKVFKASDSAHRLLYISLVHLEKSGLANHAYANKILSKKVFIPKGNGITKEGKIFIKECYNTEGGKQPIYIDVKHMSLRARKQLYKMREDGEIPSMPILATHSGLTGCSWKKELPIKKYRKLWLKKYTKLVYEKPRGHVPYTLFNPISINLYDEDIEEILKSGGLIGLTLDARILGAGANGIGAIKRQEKEFISNLEDDDFFGMGFNYTKSRFSFRITERDDIEDEKEDDNELKAYDKIHKTKIDVHMNFFFNTLVHIYKVGKKAIENPLKQVCIGTDFDGLIKPIENCENATEMSNIKELLINMLSKHGSRYGIEGNSEKIAKDIMLNNGVEFMKKYFN